MAIEFTDREKASMKRDEAIGCGCAVLIPGFAGPFITDFIGLTSWPVPVLFLGLAIVMFVMKTSTSKLSWQAEMAFAVLGFAASTFAAVMIATRPAAPAVRSAPAPTSAPTGVATPPPPTNAQKEVVRITIDEIQEKFAKNQIAGAQFFETRTALIPGVAVRVREAIGAGILIVRSPKTRLEMEIGFGERGTQQLGDIKPGDRIEATCPMVYEALSQVIIACDSVEIKPNR